MQTYVKNNQRGIRQMIKLQLHENWQLCNIRQLDWIPAQIPGDIYAALLKTGKMPDPFFGDNEYQAKALMCWGLCPAPFFF